MSNRDKQHTSNIRGDVPIPTPTSLLEESTKPVLDNEQGGYRHVPVSSYQIGRELERFLQQGNAPHLSRGMPFVDQVVFDDKLGCPHVWLYLKAPFTSATEATKKLVRAELEAFADRVWRYFPKGFAISVVLE